ncbi:DedA family protein [Allohahella sp. A8]|uniref:DedA family protein n=1 Tax=Allohahella sp. A8 TaxID=3141461 RepID=UPI003A809C88
MPDMDVYQSFSAMLARAGEYPSVMLMLLFMATFILEDLATSSGALLAAAGVIDPWSALLVLYAGILLGDVALYILGQYIRRSRHGPRLAEVKGLRLSEDLLRQRWAYTIFVSRFIPGARLPTFTAAGFFGYSVKNFVLLLIFAVGLWTSISFWIIYGLGDATLELKPAWAGVGIVVLLLLGAAWPYLLRLCTGNRSGTPDESL